jgi:hypothetical protein
VSPYRELSSALAYSGAIRGDLVPGLKFAALRDVLVKWSGWRRYKYVILADDDLIVPPGTWTRFLDRAAQYGAALAAPALLGGSVASHPVTLQAPRCAARRTEFIEIMMPCFRMGVLAKLLDTFELSPSGIGWGLDYVWARRLDYTDIFVIDETPVAHRRPSANDAEAARRGGIEMSRMMARYGLANTPPREGTISCLDLPLSARASPAR